MKVRLPIIGQVVTGSDIETPTPVKASEKIFDGILGGFLNFGTQQLSNEKSISNMLLAANTGWVYRNNDVIAQEVSKIEFELFTIGLSEGEIVYNEIKSHPLLDLLDQPNTETSKNDALYIIQSHKKLTGDAFWLKIRNGSQVIALRELPPDKIVLNLQAPTPTDPTVILNYIYKDTINGEQVTETYETKDIIHFKKPNPRNAFRGLGAVEALKETIDLDNLTSDTTMKYFLNGAIQNFALTTDAKITEDQLKRLKAEIRASISGNSNAFNVPIFGGGLTPTDISYSNKEMQFLDQLEWYRDKIMVGFGNTKASIGIIDDVNRASHESSINSWLNSTVMPDMQAIVNTLNEFLVPEFGENLVLGFANPVPEDRTDDIEEATKLYAGNIITRAEARDMLDYDVEDTDAVYFQSNMGTLIPDDEAVDTEDPEDELPQDTEGEDED